MRVSRPRFVRGRNVVSAPWNDAFEPFAHGPVVIRSTWDYHETPDAYVAWLDRLPTGRAFNPPSLIRWNLAKTYVLDLAQRGAPVPRSRAAVAEPGAVAAAMTALGLHDAVIKPLIGTRGLGLDLVAGAAERFGDAVIARLSSSAARPQQYGTDVHRV